MEEMVYIRKCQECGHEQQMTPPTEYKNDRWRDVKCRKCKSVAMDYGSYKLPKPGKDNEPSVR